MTPPYLPGNPLSIVLWSRPPLGTPFAPSPADYWLQVTPLFSLPIPIGSSSTFLSRSFLLAQTTPSHLSPDSTFSMGSSPSHLSFILRLVPGAWVMRVNQTHPCPQFRRWWKDTDLGYHRNSLR